MNTMEFVCLKKQYCIEITVQVYLKVMKNKVGIQVINTIKTRHMNDDISLWKNPYIGIL